MMRLLSGPHLISAPSLHHRRYPDLNPYVRLRGEIHTCSNAYFAFSLLALPFACSPKFWQHTKGINTLSKMPPQTIQGWICANKESVLRSEPGRGRKQSWRAVCINHILEHCINSQHSIGYLKEKFSTLLPRPIEVSGFVAFYKLADQTFFLSECRWLPFDAWPSADPPKVTSREG
jgi:hypothetical protein